MFRQANAAEPLIGRFNYSIKHLSVAMTREIATTKSDKIRSEARARRRSASRDVF